VPDGRLGAWTVGVVRAVGACCTVEGVFTLVETWFEAAGALSAPDEDAVVARRRSCASGSAEPSSGIVVTTLLDSAGAGLETVAREE
jgi:hypothetical protein